MLRKTYVVTAGAKADRKGSDCKQMKRGEGLDRGKSHMALAEGGNTNHGPSSVGCELAFLRKNGLPSRQETRSTREKRDLKAR